MSDEENTQRATHATQGGDAAKRSAATAQHSARAQSATWQAIERIGRRYLHTSKRVAQLLSALKER